MIGLASEGTRYLRSVRLALGMSLSVCSATTLAAPGAVVAAFGAATTVALVTVARNP